MSRPRAAAKLIACVICNKAFYPKWNWNQEQYCSDNCKNVAWLTRTQANRWAKTRTCVHCGQTFVARNAGNKWCSALCSGKGLRREKTCKRCNKVFSVTHHNQEHCSLNCRQNVGFITKQCSECGEQFGGGRASNLNTRCQECRIKGKTHQCAQCGEVFVRGNGPKNAGKYCSFECYLTHIGAKKEGALRGSGWTRTKKRGLNGNVFGSSITIKKLIDRDGDRCGICGIQTDYTIKPSHDAYPTVDHILPISHGGQHEWQNVRIACRKCNIRRNNKSSAIQTALPMVLEIRGTFGEIIMTPVAREHKAKQ